MTRAGHWAAVLQRTLARACGVVLALMLAAVTATTLQRYLLGSGFLGIEEAMVWLLLLLACLGFPMIADGALAMRIELFAHGRKSRWATLRETLAEAFTLAACGVLAIAGTKAALDVGGHSALLGLGEWMRPAALGLAGAAGIAMRMLVLAGARRMGLLLAAGTVAALMLMPVAAELSSSLLSPSLSALMVIGIGILVGAPLVHAFVLAGYAALAFGSMLVEPALALSLLGGIGRYLLLAIPFFLLAGGLLTISGAAGDLVRFAAARVGRRRAGLGQTVLLTSVLFSGVSGSSIANAAFSSKTFMKPLTAAGYTPERAGAIIASTAVLDNIIPPSIAFLILAAATNLPVGPLLTGGLFAGLALAAALAVAIHFRAVIAVPTASEPQASRARLALRAVPVFGLGLIVVAGIRFGIVSPTEAAALAAAYTLVLALCGRHSRAGIFAALQQAGVETAAITMLIGAATPLAFLLAIDGIGPWATGLARSFGENPFMVMIAANLILLGVGLVLDIGAAILLFSPILLPVAAAVGIDPVAFGVVVVVNLMIGGLTPPVGILVQVTSAATGVPATRLFSATRPYLAALLLALLCISMGIAAHAAFLSP
jgi:tripartite ATP-independent transporter DctM subunit